MAHEFVPKENGIAKKMEPLVEKRVACKQVGMLIPIPFTQTTRYSASSIFVVRKSNHPRRHSSEALAT
jgi:hypothetical protein